MVENVSTLEIRGRLGNLLDRVALRSDSFVILRRGKPLAALVPVSKLLQMESSARATLAAALERGGAGLTQAETDALADRAKHSSRSRPARRTKKR